MKLLSQKLYQLQHDTNKQTGFTNAMCRGFDSCIAHAERLEKQLSKNKNKKLPKEL